MFIRNYRFTLVKSFLSKQRSSGTAKESLDMMAGRIRYLEKHCSTSSDCWEASLSLLGQFIYGSVMRPIHSGELAYSSIAVNRAINSFRNNLINM